jgi:two-component system chemotaxis response regulator CheB
MSIAPGDDRHLGIGGTTNLHAKLRRGEPVSGHLPSVDVLFSSVAEVVGAQAVGILLTGMGSDGAKGLLAMAQKARAPLPRTRRPAPSSACPVRHSLGAAKVVAPIGHIARHAFSKAA